MQNDNTTFTPKNSYSIADLMAAMDKSRATIKRMRERGEIPEPDIGKDTKTRPIWFHATIAAHLPNLTTNS